MPKFIECEHPNLPGQTAVLATTALRHMPGWAPVSREDAPESPRRKGVGGKRTDRKAGTSTIESSEE